MSCARQQVTRTRRLDSGPRTAGIGASRPLQRIPAIVSFLNPQPALSLAGGNRSSCPSTAIAGRPEQRRGRVALRPLVVRELGAWAPRDNGQIRTSLRQTGALHNVECVARHRIRPRVWCGRHRSRPRALQALAELPRCSMIGASRPHAAADGKRCRSSELFKQRHPLWRNQE